MVPIAAQTRQQAPTQRAHEHGNTQQHRARLLNRDHARAKLMAMLLRGQDHRRALPGHLPSPQHPLTHNNNHHPPGTDASAQSCVRTPHTTRLAVQWVSEARRTEQQCVERRDATRKLWGQHLVNTMHGTMHHDTANRNMRHVSCTATHAHWVRIYRARGTDTHKPRPRTH